MTPPDRPGLGVPEGEESAPSKPSKTWWGDLLGKLGSTKALDAAKLRVAAENEEREDDNKVALAQIAADTDARKARYVMIQRVAIAVVVCTVAALAVVYGRSFSSSILSIGEDGETKVETKTQGAP